MEAKRHRTILIAALAFATVLAAATPAISDTPIWSLTASGSLVSVTLHNGGSTTMCGTLTVSALTATSAQTRFVPVSVAPQSFANVPVGFSSPVVGALTATMTDSPMLF